MALTAFQREVVRALAAMRRQTGQGYVAGGGALNALTGAPRVSEDLDLFHDAAEAVHASFEVDRRLLQSAGMAVNVRREWATFVEADVEMHGEATRVQWAQDSAYRFFPLVEHEELGVTLHPFDLATNKVLALVGRAEPRDWVDVIECDARIQPLGYLVWAAAGKDPGLNPTFILNEAARTGRYTTDELAPLAFEGANPSAPDLAGRWKAMLAEARRVTDEFPPGEVGTCVCWRDGTLMRADAAQLREALAAGQVLFHQGRLYGALPAVA